MPFRRPSSRKWQISVNGVRISAGTEDFQEAKILEAKLNHDVWLANKMGVKPPLSWKAAVVRFLKENAHKASIDTTIYRLRWADPYLGHISDIRAINRDLLDSILTQRRGAKSTPCSANSTANRHMAAVSAVLGAACNKWDWIERKPIFRSYPEPESASRALEVHEWFALKAELPEHLKHCATVALATGLRAEKVFKLEWSQIDMQRRMLTTKGTANKLGVTIPLNETAMSILREIHTSPVRHLTRVFTYDGIPLDFYGRAWNKAMNRAGIEGFNWHGLRHTCATWLAREGVPKEIRERLCGWSSRETSDRYTHLEVEHLRKHAAVIDTVLAQSAGVSDTHFAVSA